MPLRWRAVAAQRWWRLPRQFLLPLRCRRAAHQRRQHCAAQELPLLPLLPLPPPPLRGHRASCCGAAANNAALPPAAAAAGLCSRCRRCHLAALPPRCLLPLSCRCRCHRRRGAATATLALQPQHSSTARHHCASAVLTLPLCQCCHHTASTAAVAAAAATTLPPPPPS